MTNPTPQPDRSTALTLEQQLKLTIINKELEKTDDVEALRQICYGLWQQQMLKDNLFAEMLRSQAAGEPCSMKLLVEYIQYLQAECSSHGVQVDGYSAWSGKQ